MVQLGQLRLFHCSETIKTHSLSGFYKLAKRRSHSCTSLLSRYADRHRDLNNMCLHDFYYHCKHNPEEAKQHCIPHFVGTARPVYPVEEPYAELMLILYAVEEIYHTYRTAIHQFYKFVESKDCPIQLKIEFERAKAKHYRTGGTVELSAIATRSCISWSPMALPR